MDKNSHSNSTATEVCGCPLDTICAHTRYPTETPNDHAAIGLDSYINHVHQPHPVHPAPQIANNFPELPEATEDFYSCFPSFCAFDCGIPNCGCPRKGDDEDPVWLPIGTDRRDGKVIFCPFYCQVEICAHNGFDEPMYVVPKSLLRMAL